MKEPAVGETDKLRAITEDPALRALMERYYAAPLGERDPILEAFAEKADELHPDWRGTVERAERDGVILRAMFIHTLKEARARPDLTEFEQSQIKNVEAEFVTIFELFFRRFPRRRRTRVQAGVSRPGNDADRQIWARGSAEVQAARAGRGGTKGRERKRQNS